MSLIQISIHAPRIGSDKFDCVVASGPAWISIHAPRMGSDRPSCEKRPLYEISIHAPRMGSDRRCVPHAWPCCYFNPRSPDGERRRIVRFQASRPDISIHAPRMGSDRRFRPFAPRNRYFNPRSPDGERRTSSADLTSGEQFQSTLPGWGATRPVRWWRDHPGISIHAPRMGSDDASLTLTRRMTYFNPRSPDGERPVRHCGRQGGRGISIHAPRMGSDGWSRCHRANVRCVLSNFCGPFRRFF